MPPTYFPLRWESTGDQWWYASPIDWAAANGHYDLVRELLRLDSNHLIKLTSLRRIRRLETVWDDEEQFHGVAKCRACVARRLFHHCEPKKAAAKNSLIRAGYGGWLIYTAASAGDLSFVHELLERNPLLVFGEGEYGVTDVLYAAARSKSCEVFRLLLDYASAPRFAAAGKGGGGDAVEDVPRVYKWEMINRAVHAAARGGNLRVLKELLANCSDVLAYRDAQGSTILHTAAGRGQVEIVKFLIENFDTIITSTDHHGNTALHVAAYRGQLGAAEALISALPSSIHLKNSAGETFLHKAVSGFQTLQFRRLDRQIELLKQLVRSEIFNIRDVVNAKNNEDRTALHTAVIGNVHSDLVQLLMMADSIDVNAADADGMTPLDYLKQKPRSASSDVLIRQLISAGAIFGSQDYNARKIIVSRMKMQAGNGSRSPGSSFRISDAEIFLYTGIENAASSEIGFGGGRGGGGGGGSGGIMSPASLELSPYNADETANFESRRSSFAMFKQVLNWPKMRDKKNLKKSNNNNNKSIDYEVPIDYQTNKVCNSSSELEPPTPLRKRFSKPSSPNQSNKRTLAVRSNQSSPSAKKKLASGMRNGVMQAIPRRSSRSSSFSKSSISSPSSLDKQKGICIEADIAGPSCSINNNNNQELGNGSGNGNSKRLKSQYYLCFGNGGVSVKSPVNRQQQQQQSYKLRPVSMVA